MYHVFVFILIYFLLNNAIAEEPFAGVGLDVEHHKHPSMLCHSGGMTRNMTYTLKAMAGIESSDVRYYAFYKAERCLGGGDNYEREYAPFVSSRDESMGVSFEWKTNW